MSTSWQPPDPDPSRSQEPQPQQSEPQWSQPPFAPGYQEPQQFGSPIAPPPPPFQMAPVVSGPVLIPGGRVPPAGLLEATLRVISGLVWPLVILVVIFGAGSWVGGIVFAIIASTILKRVSLELRRRRIAGARVVPPPPGPDLR